MSTIPDRIHILHIGDEPDLTDTAAAFLEREDDRFAVATATSVSEGLNRLADEEFECVISDYEMPGKNGIECLEIVREEYPELPFILYTGKGSETVASNAIAAGVTDYLQKERGTSQYAILANRVRNAVEQYRTRSKRADREQRLELFIEQSPLGVIEWDENFDVVRLNTAAKDILRYADDELTGWSWEMIVPESDRDAVDDVVSGLLEDTGGYHSINENIRNDGERIVCEWHNRVVTDDDGDVVAIFSQFQDVTEREARKQELEQRTAELTDLTDKLEDQYRRLFEEAPVMIVETRSEGDDPIVEDCNHLFTETLGHDKGDVLGRPLAEFYTDESQQRLLEEGGYNRSLDGEFTREDRELVTADGETVETLLRAVPRYDATGEVAGTIAYYIDISKRKKLQRERDRLEEFTRIVSHDLRNPLNVADGRVELAREECDSKHLDGIAKALDRMEVLIEDLLTLAREGAKVSELDPVGVDDLTGRCWQNVETGAATLVADIDQPMRADRSRLAQLLENLFRNAVEHGGADVTITVGELTNGFYIADDGPGIPEDKREQIFESGYTTSDEGTGFGLAIVRQIVEAHDWTIRATESDAGGAQFEITGVEFTE